MPPPPIEALVTKEEILERTLKIYSECDSFREVTRVCGGETIIGDFRGVTYLEIETKFIRPHWAYVSSTLVSDIPSLKPMNPGVPLTKVASTFVANEEGVQSTYFRASTTQQTFSSLVSALKQTNPRAELRLIHLLMRKESGFLCNVKGIAQFADKNLDGENCHHLVIYAGKQMTKTSLWVNSESGLVKQSDLHLREKLPPAINPATYLNAVGRFLTGDRFELSFNVLDPHVTVSAELNPPLDSESFFLPLE